MVEILANSSSFCLESFYKVDDQQVTKDLNKFGKLEALILCAKLNLLTSDGGSRVPAIGHVQAIRLLHSDGVLPKAWYNKLRERLCSTCKSE